MSDHDLVQLWADIEPTYGHHADGTRVERLEDLPRFRAAATPHAPAMVTTTATTTYGELDRAASRLANALSDIGVQPGDRVAYLGENSPYFLFTLYGASKIGAIPTALNARLAPAEVEYILRDCEPQVIVLGIGSEHLVETAEAAGVRVVVTLAEHSGAVTYDEWVSTASEDDPGFARAAEETALILYTSGTTGHPKGIELTGANIGQALGALQHELDLDQTSVTFAPVPFFHVAGLGLALVSAVNGASMLLFNAASPTDLSRILRDYRVSHGVAVPTVIQFLLTLPDVRASDWSALKCIVYGASPMPEPVLREATEVFGCRFMQSYGLTESTGGITMLSPQDHRPTAETVHRLRSVGRVVHNAAVRVVDPGTLEDLGPGERGEVLIGGGQLMRGYWRNPEATAAAFVQGGWLRTGDGGSLDADGYLYLHDRLKDMIVSGVRTFIRPRSKACSPVTPRSPRSRWSVCRRRSGARRRSRWSLPPPAPRSTVPS